MTASSSPGKGKGKGKFPPDSSELEEELDAIATEVAARLIGMLAALSPEHPDFMPPPDTRWQPLEPRTGRHSPP